VSARLALLGFLATAAAGTLIRTAASTDKAPQDAGPSSQGIYVKDGRGFGSLFIAGQIGQLPNGTMVSGGITEETHQALSNIEAILASEGLSMSDVFECHCLLADIKEFKAFDAVYASFFPGTGVFPYPARAAFQVAELPLGVRTEIKCIAAGGKSKSKHLKHAVVTKDAPAAIGSYSQAVVVTNEIADVTVAIAGQIGLLPNGTLVGGGISEQTHQALTNIKNILKAADATMDDIVECHCLLTDIKAFTAFNSVYASFFSDGAYPARAAFAVTALPLGVLTEIKCTAAKSAGGHSRSVVATKDAPAAIGAYSQAIAVTDKAGDASVYIAGQIGLLTNGTMVAGGITEQTHQALTNIKNILKAAGATMDDIVECHCLLADIEAFTAFNTVYASFFSGSADPARAALQNGALPDGALTEIKCIAARSA